MYLHMVYQTDSVGVVAMVFAGLESFFVFIELTKFFVFDPVGMQFPSPLKAPVLMLAGGQDHLKGKVFRIGHLGFVCDRDVITAVAAIEATLQELGLAKAAIGAGVGAAALELAR